MRRQIRGKSDPNWDVHFLGNHKEKKKELKQDFCTYPSKANAPENVHTLFAGPGNRAPML